MNNTQAQQVPHDKWDHSTMLNPVDASTNRAWPTLNIPPTLPRPAIGEIIVMFRAVAQSRVGKSPIHTVVYNLLSMNHFNNDLFRQWCQQAVDFIEFLAVCQPTPEGIPIEKGVFKVYTGLLGITSIEHPHINQMLNPASQDSLRSALAELQDILSDVQAFQQRGRRPMQAQQPTYGGGYGSQQYPQQPPQQPQYPQQGQPYPQQQQPQYGTPGQLPPTGPAGAYGRPPQAQMSGMAPTGYSGAGGGFSQPPTSVTEGPRPTGGRYADEPGHQSWTAGASSSNPSNNGPWTAAAPVSPQPLTQAAEEAPSPGSLDDINMDPWHHVPAGKVVTSDDPYGSFYNPGGVEIRPAHRSEWTRSKGTHTKYAKGYDPQEYCLFHVKWPDGTVEEKLTPWTDDMNYLKHELDSKLRGMKLKPTGRVVASTQRIVDYDKLKDVVNDEVLSAHVTGDLDIESELNPLVLDTLFSASSDLENELLAQAVAIETLELPADFSKLPAYEYLSGKIYPLGISADAETELLKLITEGDLVVLANGLKTLTENGDLSVRYYRFINDRLTLAFNRVLTDSLSLGKLTVDSFSDDVQEMLVHLSVKYDKGLVTVIKSQTPAFLKRHLNLAYEEVERDDDGEVKPQQLCLFEECVNLQTRWCTEDIASVGMLTGDAVLISKTEHAHLWDVMASMITRNVTSENLPDCSLRLITADGTYYEVLKGWLVKGSLLLKKHA